MQAELRELAKNAGISLKPSLTARARQFGAPRFQGSLSRYVAALIERDLSEFEPLRREALAKLTPEERAALFCETEAAHGRAG